LRLERKSSAFIAWSAEREVSLYTKLHSDCCEIDDKARLRNKEVITIYQGWGTYLLSRAA